ncbi:hypothetical protein AB1Y20_016173 [Prymnesium parvum]|uniref:Uncharacterized protein n=1 Tax=Prymnesium parvum TaxID=97485 RepID=A0AB34IC12_PRYPA
MRCVAPVLPWGKHETSADFAQRLEAMLLLPRKRGEFKGAHAPLVLPKGRAESAASFAARLKAAAVCEVLLPQSKDETDDMFQRRAAVQVMTLQTEALAPYNSQLETLEEYDMRLSAALPPEESIRSMTSTASYRRRTPPPAISSPFRRCLLGAPLGQVQLFAEERRRLAVGHRAEERPAFQAVVDEGAVFRPQTIVGTPDEADGKAPCGCVCTILHAAAGDSEMDEARALRSHVLAGALRSRPEDCARLQSV